MKRRAFIRLAALAPVVAPTAVKAMAATPSVDTLSPDLFEKAIARARALPKIHLVEIEGKSYYVVSPRLVG